MRILSPLLKASVVAAAVYAMAWLRIPGFVLSLQSATAVLAAIFAYDSQPKREGVENPFVFGFLPWNSDGLFILHLPLSQADVVGALVLGASVGAVLGFAFSYLNRAGCAGGPQSDQSFIAFATARFCDLYFSFPRQLRASRSFRLLRPASWGTYFSSQLIDGSAQLPIHLLNVFETFRMSHVGQRLPT
jgi:hypothetical protein